MKEPETDAELEAALENINCEVIDTGGGFSVRDRSTSSQSKLEAEDISNALFEAWNLMKP